MTELENWLRLATRHLSKDAIAKVRTEIAEHYESAYEAAVASGAGLEEAARRAVNDLGDPRIANCDYRRVLLTAQEARLLSGGKWEAQAVCSRPWLKSLIATGHLLLLATAAAFYVTGHAAYAGDAFLAAVAMSPFVAALLLPVNTPKRGLTFRCAKWIAITLAPLLLFGPHAMKYSWLLVSCFGPLAITEWTRASIRRKLPIKSWPRHLYL